MKTLFKWRLAVRLRAQFVRRRSANMHTAEIYAAICQNFLYLNFPKLTNAK